jgi:AcrR family transcriptional regulator
MDTKTRIQEEALKQFNEHGLNRVGVREIARSLKISPGNMSYHFPKKEELVLEILLGFSADNQRLFTDYCANEKGLFAFLNLMRGIFRNQYRYRGLLVDLVEINRLLTAATDFDYATFPKRRKEEFRDILMELCDMGDLSLDHAQLELLVSHISLFGRFWIAEAFLDSSTPEANQLIDHYSHQFAQYLNLFATEHGRVSVKRFLDD